MVATELKLYQLKPKRSKGKRKDTAVVSIRKFSKGKVFTDFVDIDQRLDIKIFDKRKILTKNINYL